MTVLTLFPLVKLNYSYDKYSKLYSRKRYSWLTKQGWRMVKFRSEAGLGNPSHEEPLWVQVFRMTFL